MPVYSIVQNAKIVAHAGAVKEIADVMKDAGYKKAFLVFDQGVKAVGVVDKVIDSIKTGGLEFVEFGEVIPDPPSTVIVKGAGIMVEEKCDCIIAIGGGSSTDTAKGINVMRVNGGNILEYANPEKQAKNCPGLICVPTTSGTGSELSLGIIVTDLETATKVPILATYAMSEYVICDPELTYGMPAGLTMMTGLDVFSHAFESYTSVVTHEMANIIQEKIMCEVVKYLPRAVANPKDEMARQRMLYNASMGGWMLCHGLAHVGHSLAHVIGAKFHIPHGAACAYGAPATIRYIAKSVPEKTKVIGEALGVVFKGDETPEQIGTMTADAYIAFRDSLGLKPISSYGVTKEQLVGIAKDVAAEPFAGCTPGGMNEEIAAQLLAECYY
ncbi:MAG: iron-containing alcohol dehydrogenase [archaeon]|nr:iron-containing alcohol dehydrogenase [archaeon]